MDKTAYFEQLRQKRKNDILDAAKDMILQQGMDDFNIQQLSRELDISTVTLYKYFKNNEDIMLALQEQILGTRQLPRLKCAPDDNPLDTFLNFHRALYRDVLMQRENVTLLALFEVYLRNRTPAQEQPLFLAYTTQIQEFLLHLLEEAKSRKLISDMIATEEALEFIMSLNLALIRQIGLMEDKRFKQEKETVKRQIEQLLNLFILYLKNGILQQTTS